MTPLFAHRLSLDRDRSFERVYRKHVRDVYGFALGVLGNPSDAEDVTQTAFLNAYRALARGKRVENPRAWLLAIAQNVCRQRFRTAARRPQEVELDAEATEGFTDEEAPSAEEIRAAMSHLAFNQRSVLVLREIEGLSYAEIAETMGLSLSAVETLLFRARRALREQLEAGDRPLGCDAAELFISRQVDGRLSRHERGRLRAHLRACPGCAGYARSQRAQRKVLRSLAAIPLPAGLAGALGSSLGGGLAAKAAAVAVGAAMVGTGVAVGTGAVPPPWSPADGQRERLARPVSVAPAVGDTPAGVPAARRVFRASPAVLPAPALRPEWGALRPDIKRAHPARPARGEKPERPERKARPERPEQKAKPERSPGASARAETKTRPEKPKAAPDAAAAGEEQTTQAQKSKDDPPGLVKKTGESARKILPPPASSPIEE